MGGMVLETNMTEIMTRIEEQNKIEKEEVIKGITYHFRRGKYVLESYYLIYIFIVKNSNI